MTNPKTTKNKHSVRDRIAIAWEESGDAALKLTGVVLILSGILGANVIISTAAPTVAYEIFLALQAIFMGLLCLAFSVRGR